MSSEQDYVRKTQIDAGIVVIVGYSKELSGSRLLGTVDIVRQIF
jgi:hypothetical protein